MASAKRRMAPFSTSLMPGFDSRPVALRSTMCLLLSARRQIQNADEAWLRAVDEGRCVHHRPGGGLVPGRTPWDEHPDSRFPDQLDFIPGLRGAQGDGQVEIG